MQILIMENSNITLNCQCSCTVFVIPIKVYLDTDNKMHNHLWVNYPKVIVHFIVSNKIYQFS